MIQPQQPSDPEPRGKGRRKTRRTLVVLAAVAAVALIGLAVASGALAWQRYWIPAGAMKPTLLVGDYIVVKGHWRYEPAQGEVVVYRHPVNGAVFISRIIGLPGDRVQMVAGALHLNGARVETAPAGDFTEIYEPQGPAGGLPRCANAPVAMGETCLKHLLRETLPGGPSYYVLNIGASFADDTPVFTVPEGHLFMMGDNRDNSQDSRFDQRAGGVGFVPVDNVLGRARFTLFSSAGRSLLFAWTWRRDRFFKAIE